MKKPVMIAAALVAVCSAAAVICYKTGYHGKRVLQ